MSEHQENGIVYHVDFELLKKAREMDIQKQIAKIENQIENAQQDLRLITTAESALGEIQTVLMQMRDIALQVASNPDVDRKKLNKLFEVYKARIDAIIESARVCGINLLDGSMGNINSIIAAVEATLK